MLRTLLLAVAGALALLLGCELLLRLLPVSSATRLGYYQAPLILSYPAGHRFTTSTGWDLRNPQLNHANNAGFVSSHDFVARADAIGLIGDSYVESSMLPMSERPAAQLERRLPGREVYAMGGPGSSLLDYAERMRWAQQHFGLQDFVIVLEGGDLWQSLCGSGQVHGPCLDPKTYAARTETMPDPTMAKRVFRESALAGYVMGQLKFSPSQLWRQVLAQARPPSPDSGSAAPAYKPPSISPGAAQVAEAFFARIADLHPRRLVFVLDARRTGFEDGSGDLRVPDLVLFATLARAHGAEVVEAADVLAPDHATNGLSFDVGPYDHHMNARTWGLLMSEVAGRLKGPPGR